MNWRLITSSTRAVDVFATTLRVVLAASLIACGWMGYRFYVSAGRVSTLGVASTRNVADFGKLRSDFDKQKQEAGAVSQAQLVCDAPAEFAALLSDACRAEGVRIAELQTESVERSPLDNLEGGGAVGGWKSLGHTVELEGPCRAVHAVLERLQSFPMPMELTGIDVKRIGLVGNDASLIRLAFTVDIFEPGAASGVQQAGST